VDAELHRAILPIGEAARQGWYSRRVAAAAPATELSLEGLNTDIGRFDDFGYVVIPGFLPREEAAEIWETIDELQRAEEHRLVHERILLHDQRFLEILRRPPLLEYAERVLGEDLQLLSLESVETLPSSGPLRAWHVDLAHFSGPPLVVNWLVYLQDMTDDAGPFYFVPGSHKWGRKPLPEEADTPLRGEVKFSTAAGGAIFFHHNLWHSGSRNDREVRRHVLFYYFGKYWLKRFDEFYRDPLPERVTLSDDPLLRQLFGLGLRGRSIHGAVYSDRVTYS
jgi:hypothetical protein